jgi:branched-chain amino acid transport system permease protein
MDLASILIQTLNSVQYGLLLFLVASGLTLVFGIMGIINLAHGSFYMIGAYMAFVLTSFTGNLFLAILLGIPLALALGAFLEWALFSHLYKRDHLEQVLLTYGLILIFEEIRSILIGDDVHGVAIPSLLNFSIQLNEVLSYPFYRVAISIVCIILAIGMFYLIQKTKLGMMIRAGSHDRTMVQALGININMIYRVVFALGLSLAALAGMLASPISSVYPNMGSQVCSCSYRWYWICLGSIGSSDDYWFC